MILQKLFMLLRAKPGLARAQALKYLKEHHGPIVLASAVTAINWRRHSCTVCPRRASSCACPLAHPRIRCSRVTTVQLRAASQKVERRCRCSSIKLCISAISAIQTSITASNGSPSTPKAADAADAKL